jgi:guanylate kinase
VFERVKKSEIAKDCYYLFLGPPSLQHLEDRLRSRGTETEEAIQRRLHNAGIELKYKDIPNFWDSILINSDLDETYEKFRDIVVPMVTKERAGNCSISTASTVPVGDFLVCPVHHG